MRTCDKCGGEIGVPTTPEAWFWDFIDGEVFENVKHRIGHVLGTFVEEKLLTQTQVGLCGTCNGSITIGNRHEKNLAMEEDRLDFIQRLRNGTADESEMLTEESP